MNGLFEILGNKEWMLQPEFLHSILPTIQYNISSHSSLGIERSKKNPMVVTENGMDVLREYQVTEDGTVVPVRDGWTGEDILGNMKEPFVNVIPVDGPITRNGGACSYGSRDIRDWMMKAADNRFCQAHVIIINTPGGSLWAKNDFKQAIDYAHSKGQRVIAFIDGLCASAGMYLASLCDEVYVMNPKDQLGCVGVMAVYLTVKNGEKNQFTGETYHEYYATKSIFKNKEVRDIAEDDDATLLIEELDQLEAEFRSDMKASFPDATDDHLSGKLFYAEDVMGILCDGQMMLGDVINRAFGLASGVEKPIERTAGRQIGQLAAMQQPIIPNNNKSLDMKEKYQTLASLLGVEELVVTEEGSHLDLSLLDTLQTRIEELQAKAAKVDDLTNQVESLAETIKTNEETIATQKEMIDSLTTTLDGMKTSITTAEQTIAERDQTISDLQSQVEELQRTPGAEPATGKAPASNGEGAEAAHQSSNAPQWDPAKSATENKRAMEEYERQLKSQIR